MQRVSRDAAQRYENSPAFHNGREKIVYEIASQEWGSIFQSVRGLVDQYHITIIVGAIVYG